MKKVLLIASLVAMATSGLAQAAGDAEKGKAASAACAACHGADGNSGMNPVWPKLAGQHPSYIVKQLKDFKDGKRQDTTMAPMALPLTDEGMEDLAAYFSSQKTTIGAVAENKLEVGQKIYRAGNAANGVAACSACHGPAGAGNAQANFPSLSGQGAAYVAKALKDFRSGARANDMGGMMRDVASKLSDAEIDAVSSYVEGLH